MFSPMSSLGSYSSGETDDTSTSTGPNTSVGSTPSILFDDRKLRLGESYFLEGNYVKAGYYFLKNLQKVKKFFPESDDRVINAHEKFGDAQVMANDDKTDAISNYRVAINELRVKKQNSKVDDVELIKRFSRVLVNCGNALLQMSKTPNLDTENLTKYCNDAIACYEESLPMVQVSYGLKANISLELAQRFCFAREILANRFASEDKTNMAVKQYEDINTLFQPYMLEFFNNSTVEETQANNYYKAIEYLFLKHTIHLGLSYLRQERLDELLHLFGEALRVIGLKENDVDEQKLQNLNPKVHTLVSNISHNLGVVLQKRKLYLEAIVHFKRVIFLKEKSGSCCGFSILGLGQTYFDLNDYNQALPNLLEAEKQLKFDQATTYNEVFEICLRNIATIYETRKEYTKCIQHLEKLIQLLQRTLSSEIQMKKLSSVCHRLACVHFQEDNYEEAIKAHKQSLAYRRNAGNPADISSTLSHMGNIYVLTEQHSMAFSCYTELLGYCDNKQKISTYYEIGNILSHLNRYPEAVEHYESCFLLASGPESVIQNISIIAKCVCKLGPLLVASKDYPNAISKYEDGLQFLKQVDENKEEFYKDRLDILLGLGKTYISVANYDFAMHYFLDAKQLLVQHIDEDETTSFLKEYKECYLSIAKIHEQRKEIDLCLVCLVELIQETTLIVEDEFECDMEVIAILHEKACVQFRAQHYQSSLESHKDVLSAKKKAYDKTTDDDPNSSSIDISFTLRCIGEVYAKMKMYKYALDTYKQALSAIKDCTTKALILCDIGRIFVILQSNDEALNSFQSALSLVFDQDSSEDSIIPKVLRHIASIYADAFDRFEDAVRYYQKAQLFEAENFAEDCEEVMHCLNMSDFLDTHVEALRTFQQSKKKCKIVELCTTYDEFILVSKELSKSFLHNHDYDSCVRSLKAMINLALLLSNDQYTLNEEVSLSLHRIGCVQKEARNYSDSVKYHQLSLAVKHIVNETCTLDTSISYRCIGEVYAAKGEHQHAINNYREALKGLTVDEEQKIMTLDKMCISLWKMQRFDEAKECYQLAILICEQHQFTDQRILLLNNLGNVDICAGNLDEALSSYMNAISLSASTTTVTNIQNFDEDAKNVLINMGYVYFQKSAYQESFGAFKSFLTVRVSDIVSKNSIIMDSNIACVLNHLGILLTKQCHYQEALEWFQQSVNLLESLPSKNMDQFSGILSNLGFAHYYLHHYNTALIFLDQAIQSIYNKQDTRDINERLLATLVGKSASISFKMKDYESAMEGYQQALSLKKKIGITKSEELMTMHNIALIYCKKRQFNEALVHLDKIRVEKILLYGQIHPEVAKVLLDIANINIVKKDFRKAKIEINEGLDILDKANYPRNHPYQVQRRNVSKKLKKSQGKSFRFI